MASVGARRPHLFSSLLLISSLLFASQTLVSSRNLARPPIVRGLDWNYYLFSCPLVESIVESHLESVFKRDSGIAPGILRLFFHDCFAQGCDASILLNGENGVKDEKNHTANFGLRKEAIDTIEELRARIGKQCLRVVSCADILVIAAREAVRQFGGPKFDVPLGRKDSLTFDVDAPENLPPPFFKTDLILETFTSRSPNFNPTDVVALSGAHTFGVSHCRNLFNRTTDSNLPIDPDFKAQLEATCPDPEDLENPNTVNLDLRSPVKFDNLYYINLLHDQGVFTSDQDLASHDATKGIVDVFASNQKEFFKKFADAFVKVSQLDVLTGNKGEVRKSCFAPNNKKSSMSSVVEEVVELAQNL